MSITLPTVLLNPGQAQTISLLGPSAPLALKVSNKSPYDVQYSGFGVIGSDWIPSGTEYMLYAAVQSTGELILTAFNNANVTPNPGAVLISEYVMGEQLPVGHWPVSIPFQTVNATTSVATTQAIDNEGNPAGTSIIKTVVSGQTTPNQTATNEGLWDLSVLISGVLHKFLKTNASGSLLQIGNSNDATEFMGGIQMQNAANFTAKDNGGAIRFIFTVDSSNNLRIIDPTDASSIQMYSQGAVLLNNTDLNGFHITHGHLQFSTNAILRNLNGFSGTGSGNFSTNSDSVTSLYIAFNPCTVSGSSQTIGGTVGTTSTVTTGNGLAWQGININTSP